jgi:hypothetical protein
VNLLASNEKSVHVLLFQKLKGGRTFVAKFLAVRWLLGYSGSVGECFIVLDSCCAGDSFNVADSC